MQTQGFILMGLGMAAGIVLWVFVRPLWSAKAERRRICKTLRDAQHPGMLYTLIWSVLDEESDAYAALSALLFAPGAEINPALGDPSFRRKLAECVVRYPEVVRAFHQVTEQVRDGRPQTVWKRSPVEHVSYTSTHLAGFVDFLDATLDRFGAYAAALAVTGDEANADLELSPIVGLYAVDDDEDIILQTCPSIMDMAHPPPVLTVTEVHRKTTELLDGREGFNVECSESDESESDRDEIAIRLDFPVTGAGFCKEQSVFVFLNEE